jgi:tRNA threonylcarbamoyladenosine biosynthesis protein TsaB
MPRILALETSTDACSVALQVGDEVRMDHRLAPRSHARLLLPMIEALLADAALSPAGVDAIVYGRGPGSFTGLRIGCAVVQGLAFAHDVPTLGISSLEVLAEAVRVGQPQAAGVVTMLDARMGECYGAAWRVEEPGRFEMLVPERVGAPEPLIAELRETIASVPGAWALAGDVADRLLEGVSAAGLGTVSSAGPDASRWRRQAPGG